MASSFRLTRGGIPETAAGGCQGPGLLTTRQLIPGLKFRPYLLQAPLQAPAHEDRAVPLQTAREKRVLVPAAPRFGKSCCPRSGALGPLLGIPSKQAQTSSGSTLDQYHHQPGCLQSGHGKGRVGTRMPAGRGSQPNWAWAPTPSPESLKTFLEVLPKRSQAIDEGQN